MIKNIVLKKTLKLSAFKIVSLINMVVPKDDNLVLLYSANKGIQHSLRPLRKYLLDNGFNRRYEIVCGIEDMKYAEDDIDLKFVSRLASYIKFFRAKHVFYTVGQIPIKPAKSQSVIHLRHGNTNFKTSGKKTSINNGDEFFFTYMIASAPMFKPIMSEEYGCREENIAVVGDPLVDELLDSKNIKYDLGDYKKVFFWLPTFRQSDYLGYDDSMIEEHVPMFKESDYPLLNEFLGKHNVKLVIKLHPAQRDFSVERRHFKYLDIYTNKEFAEKGYKLYPFMYQSDALIGDYSSASMQYLVLDKPQAYVVPDIAEYAEKRGFIFENPEDYMAGHIIKNKEQFETFITDILYGRDPYSSKREKVRSLVYAYPDNHNCERIICLSEMK